MWFSHWRRNANILTKIYKTRINGELVKARTLLENSGHKLSQGRLFTKRGGQRRGKGNLNLLIKETMPSRSCALPVVCQFDHSGEGRVAECKLKIEGEKKEDMEKVNTVWSVKRGETFVSELCPLHMSERRPCPRRIASLLCEALTVLTGIHRQADALLVVPPNRHVKGDAF